MRVRIVLTCGIASAVALALACATTATKTEKEKQTGPVEEKLKLSFTWFDLSTCSPRQVELPPPARKESVMAWLLTARPQVMECLVDSESRGPAQLTKVTVTTTVNDSGAVHAVTGENLMPAGIACIQGLYKDRPGISPLPKGAEPVVAKVDIVHDSQVSPAVARGNEGLDAAAAIRLAMKGWCDCFSDWKESPPYTFEAKLKLKKALPTDAGTPAPGEGTTDAIFTPSTVPAVTRAEACLEPKMEALPLKHVSDEVDMPYFFILINSNLDAALPDAKDAVQFEQLEGQRIQRAADTAIRVATRLNANDVYNAAVKEYQTKKDYALVRPLAAKCQELLKADEGWGKALDAQLEVEKSTVALISKLKVTDPSWTEAETAAMAAMAAVAKDIDQAKKTRAEDDAACPRERKK